MDGDTVFTKVIDAQDRRDDIPTERVKDQHLPLCVGCHGNDLVSRDGLWLLVEVEHGGDGSYKGFKMTM